MIAGFVAAAQISGLEASTALVLMIAVAAAGTVFGYALRALIGRWQADSAEKRLQLHLDEAEAEIKARLKEADIQARAEVVKAREEFEASVQTRRADLEARTVKLEERETKLDRKAALIDVRDAQVKSAAKEADDKMSAAKTLDESARLRLEKLAGMGRDEARKTVIATASAEVREDAAALASRLQQDARDDAAVKAREIIADAIRSCAVSHASEMMLSSVQISGDDIKGRVIGRDGRNLRAFEAATGVTMLVDDTPGAIVLSSFDPVRRDIARRALEALVADGRIHPETIEAAVAKATAESEEAFLEAGSAAAAEVRVSGLNSEILRKMGCLGCRTSFSQNTLRHSVEVGLLMGRMAEEMGLDADRARRIGFLHDIGKAIESGKKGSHAMLGAEFLRAQGEDEEVALAVASHHPETGVDGGVYGVLCTAADAISSARPGARQESREVYVERLRNLESLVAAHEGVTKTYIIQAGRDVRVMVDSAKVDDAGAELLAKDICREIAEQVRIVGQIRVTVIREKRITEYAR